MEIDYIINSEMIKRQLIFDSMEDPVRVCRLVGLVGTGDDGNRAEQEASFHRLSAIGPVIPLLTEIAKWMSGVAVHVQTEGQEEELDPAFVEQMHVMFFSVLQSGLISTLSVMNAMGMVESRTMWGQE